MKNRPIPAFVIAAFMALAAWMADKGCLRQARRLLARLR